MFSLKVTDLLLPIKRNAYMNNSVMDISSIDASDSFKAIKVMKVVFCGKKAYYAVHAPTSKKLTNLKDTGGHLPNSHGPALLPPYENAVPHACSAVLD
jgi:hypothetical protein